MGAIKVFLKEVVLPIALAFCLASFLKPIYMPDGVCDYFLMWICVGLPFGIRRMCLWLVPSGYGISGSVGIFALNLIIGSLIGGLAFFIGLLHPKFFVDDGYSGTTFDRPAFREMEAMAENGEIATIVVKDYCAIIGLNQKDLENQGILA